VCTENLNPNIMVMKLPNERTSGHNAQNETTAFTFLDYSGLGLIFMAIEAIGQRWTDDQTMPQ
jgi:hypothetical protein